MPEKFGLGEHGMGCSPLCDRLHNQADDPACTCFREAMATSWVVNPDCPIHGERAEVEAAEERKFRIRRLEMAIDAACDAIVDIDPGESPTVIKNRLDDIHGDLHAVLMVPEKAA